VWWHWGKSAWARVILINGLGEKKTLKKKKKKEEEED
jgi:hypothetical protein